MKKIRKQIMLFTLALLAVFLSVSACSAADLTVGTGGTYADIQSAYGDAVDGDTILIADGNYPRTGNTQIFISKNINITGQSQNGTIIDAENENNIFTIQTGYTVTIKNLTFKDGGDTVNGGAISNSGTLNIINCTFTSNEADSKGGAIYNEGTLTANSCIFTGNSAVYGGAIHNRNGATLNTDNCIFTNNQASSDAGAIDNYGTLNVNGCVFTNNQAPWGAAIQSYGTSTVNSCTFTGNTVTEDGGAIYNSGTMTVNSCVFTGNQASKSGGAIYHRIPSYYQPMTLTVTGCNFNQNTAGTTGGAIDIDTIDTVVVKYSRFVGNSAGTAGQDIYLYRGELDARYNWWGSNNSPATGRIAQVEGTPSDEIYTPWLVMNINADPNTINTGETSKITANVYMDSNGVDHSGDAAQFFSGPEVTFTTDLGNVGSKSVTVPWTLGLAAAILRGDEGPGIATVTAADGEIKSTVITILQAPEANAASDTENTVGMQNTGLPIAGLILVILMLAGVIASKR